MAMKRLVVCCDGTWKDADNGTGYTNVSRLAWAIQPADRRGDKDIAQIVFYQSGVGSEGDIIGKLGGGGLGLGLGRNVRDAYSFICNNYAAGDEIFLFGFSRGAYTARSVGGLIGYAGLLGKADLDRFNNLWAGYRLRDKGAHDDARDKFADRHRGVRVRCIGVFDTVGSLGIPGHLGKLFTNFYAFHDTGLGEHVDFAFHALALDERRKDFLPTLWQQDPAAREKGQVLKQVWFAGVHSNVGGGYKEHGLSDVTMAWMASEIDPLLALDFDYLKGRRDLRSNWSLGRITDSADGIWKGRPTTTRTPLAENRGGTNESVHASVLERVQGKANSVPAGYVCAALEDIDVTGKVTALSPRETALRWSAADIRSAPPEDESADDPSLMQRVVGLFGGG